jgi:hypothetical protein
MRTVRQTCAPAWELCFTGPYLIYVKTHSCESWYSLGIKNVKINQYLLFESVTIRDLRPEGIVKTICKRDLEVRTTDDMIAIAAYLPSLVPPASEGRKDFYGGGTSPTFTCDAS